MATSALATTTRPDHGDGAPEIIVIDDDQAILFGMEMLLRDWGFKPYCAVSASKALEIIERQAVHPKLVLADYRLQGGQTGSEAIHKIQQRVSSDVPGIILTGDTAPDRIREAKASGHILLHKPLDPEELRRILQDLLTDR